YHILRNASIDIIRAVGVDAGGCNIQFAIHPTTGRVIVIEMNPRVSRSSALVSKATGVPIAKISARLAVGMTLDEIPNDITQNTPACFEPAIDYVVTKIPRFSFEKFPGAPDLLSPQMKSVGEVMAIGQTFQESFQKALRGLETNLKGFLFNPLDASECSVETLKENLLKPTSIRIRWIYRALFHGVSTADIYDWTGIDPWFLENLRDILDMETTLRQHTLSTLPTDLFKTAKIKGFSDAQIAEILSKKESTTEEQVRQARRQAGISVNYKSVDTCAGEFEAYTPYFYSSYDGVENEAPTPDVSKPNKRVMILGGGPNRIGQGIEFDYCCVKAALTLRELGYEAIMVNSNPETVSTDYDISDRLYFEPLTPEDVSNLLQQEKPLGVFAQLGGQTPLKLARALEEEMPILGTSSASIDLSEDRDKFKEIINTLGLLVPQSGIAFSEDEAVTVAREIGYPLIARPSYVLGGRAMRIFYNEEGLKNYLKHIVKVEPDHPVLIERFLERAVELDVDAVSDGDETMVGAILQHIEHAGVHSGDSACVWPAQNIDNALEKEVKDATAKLAKALNVVGLMNIQFAVKDGSLYVLEVNPRASRTVPFVCKATGIPLIQIGTQVMLGEKLKDIVKPYDIPNHVAVKAPVFPFIKFKGFDPMLGPEMRSTGEVMGIDTKFPAAFAKAMLGAGHKIPTSGQVFFSVNDTDKEDCLEVAKMFLEMDFSLVATSGTAAWLAKHQLPVTVIKKKHEGSPNAEELILEGRVNLLVNSPIGEEALTDDSYIRKAAVANNVPFATTITTAKAMAEAIAAVKQHSLTPKNLQENLNLIKQPT
ncbi:MAG: carbamoyl-phosphate synthase large subunit, partial [Vampirovibrio sp.]|nr:carbamoyl-phosphate synthase large subunit [Vampirovibrio sp.]